MDKITKISDTQVQIDYAPVSKIVDVSQLQIDVDNATIVVSQWTDVISNAQKKLAESQADLDAKTLRLSNSKTVVSTITPSPLTP